MATNNILNAPFPLSPTQGGLGLASPTAHGILIAEGSSAATSLVLGAGQLPIGTTSGDPSAATLTAGTNISITSASGSITIAGSGLSSFVWNNVSGTTQTAVVNQGYVISNASLTTVTLPTTAAIGDLIGVSGSGAAGWTIVYSTGQSIKFGTVSTTTTTGSLSSTQQYDSLVLQCIVANTTFKVLWNSGSGLTYV